MGTEAVCVDLGSAWTSVHEPATGRMLEGPTVYALGWGRQVIATGRAAMNGRVRARSQLRYPVRRGRVLDPAGARELIVDLLAGGVQGDVLQLAIPVGMTAYEISLLTGVVYSASGLPVTAVPSLVAAARGAGVDPGRPAMICDLGAGLVEMGVVSDDRLLSYTTSSPVVKGLDRRPLAAFRSWAEAPDRAIAAAPGPVRHALRNTGVVLVGGGAEEAGLRDRLASLWHRDVVAAADPRRASVRGLATLLARASLSA